jgi:hypothetical protein
MFPIKNLGGIILKEEGYLTTVFKSILNVFRNEKKSKKEIKVNKAIKKKVLKKKSKEKKQKKEIKIVEIKQDNLEIPKKKVNPNVQMPAPWSKVEKYKRIKKEYNY